mgnify:FL=1
MKPLTTAQLKAIATRWLKNNDTLTKTTASATKSMDEIQKQVANDLSTVKKRNEFCMFMTYQFKIDKKVNSNLQTCINKPNTQRYILKVAKDKPLTQKMSIRTPSKELLSPNHKLDGKAIITQAGIDKGKGVYACFKWDIPKPKKATGTTATQKVVTEFNYTKEGFIALANSGKIKFAE